MKFILVTVLMIIAFNTCDNRAEYWARAQQAADIVITGGENE